MTFAEARTLKVGENVRKDTTQEIGTIVRIWRGVMTISFYGSNGKLSWSESYPLGATSKLSKVVSV